MTSRLGSILIERKGLCTGARQRNLGKVWVWVVHRLADSVHSRELKTVSSLWFVGDIALRGPVLVRERNLLVMQIRRRVGSKVVYGHQGWLYGHILATNTVPFPVDGLIAGRTPPSRGRKGLSHLHAASIPVFSEIIGYIGDSVALLDVGVPEGSCSTNATPRKILLSQRTIFIKVNLQNCGSQGLFFLKLFPLTFLKPKEHRLRNRGRGTGNRCLNDLIKGFANDRMWVSRRSGDGLRVDRRRQGHMIGHGMGKPFGPVTGRDGQVISEYVKCK